MAQALDPDDTAEFGPPEAAPAAELMPPAAPDSVAAADPGLLELYKLAVEMADRVSARRATANAFFLTLTTALLAVIGLVPPAESSRASAGVSGDKFGPVLLSIAGILLSLTWLALLRSYRQLNEAKFKVINAMELRLPSAPFSDEWAYLKGKLSTTRWNRYIELGQAERLVPLLFAAIYLAASIRTLVS